MKIKINLRVIIEYLFVILMCINCNSVYQNSVKSYYTIEMCSVMAAILLIILIKKIDINTFGRWIILLFIYSVPIILLMLIGNGYTVSPFIFRYCMIVPLLILIFAIYNKSNNQYGLWIKYADVITVFSIISLILWILAGVLRIIKPTSYITAMWGTEYDYPVYFGLYAQRQTMELGSIAIDRNSFIYCEAPMYNIEIVLAIMVNLFYKERPISKKSRRKYITSMLVLFISWVTTFSTTGIILTIVMYIVHYYRHNQDSKLLKSVKKIGVPIVFVAGIIGLIYIFTSKINQTTSADQATSWDIRVDDYMAGLKAWKQSIIMGNGYATGDIIVSYMSDFRSYNQGFSNTILIFLAEGGLLMISVYIMSFVGYLRHAIKLKDFSFAITEVVMIALLFTAIFNYTVLVLFILSYGLALLIEPNPRKNRIYRIVLEKCEKLALCKRY